MLMEAGQVLEQRADITFAQFHGRPVFELSEIQHMPDDGEACVEIRPYVDIGTLDSHSAKASRDSIS